MIEEIAKNNAQKTEKTVKRQIECLFSHINDLAYSLVGTTAKTEEILPSGSSEGSVFLEKYRKISESLSKELNENQENGSLSELCEVFGFYSGFDDYLSAFCRAYLCKSICKLLENCGCGLNATQFFGEITVPKNTVIAYVKNSFSDYAYRVFSSEIPYASVLYPGNFQSVCEEVYYGRAGYCILPYETSDEGMLSGFYNLISKYELVPILTCQTDTGIKESGRFTRFALLSKGFHSIDVKCECKKYLKIHVTNPSETIISSVLECAKCNGLRHIKTESIPVVWDTGKYSCTMVFETGDGNNKNSDLAGVVPFLFFLAMEAPEVIPESIYTDIQRKNV